MTKLSARQYAHALYQTVSEVSEDDHDRVLDNFVGVLKANGHLEMFDEIEEEFHNYDREARGIKTAQVTSARELSAKEEKDIVKKLNDYVQGQVEIKKKVDENLIGGVVVKLEDELIDGSVRKQLKDLKDKLTS